jgi:AraC-like DNA-binding protein
MRQRPMKNLGMRIAAETPIGAFPLIDYLIVTSESVGAGLRQFARYARLVGSPALPRVHDTEGAIQVIYEGPPNPFAFEFGITLCLLHLRGETEGRFRAERVSLAHRPDDVPEMERVRQANEMIARLPVMSAVALEVRRVLASRVAGGDTRIGSVAKALMKSARSLQRQLAAEGLTYQELVDATRKEAAERYLADSPLPIAEVAYLLGYSEPAAFHRAFQRWNGETPRAFRLERTRPRYR